VGLGAGALWFFQGLAGASTLERVDAAIRREDLVRLSDPSIRFAVSAWLGQVDDVPEDQPLTHETLQALEEAMPVEALATSMGALPSSRPRRTSRSRACVGMRG